MAPADNTPDFDSMTPEEIMAWMETLAKRQGVKSEELTTSADVDIPEIDPDTVVIDEPGYVPYGEERPPKPSAPEPAKSEPPMAAQPPRQNESPFPPAPPAPRPFAAPPPRPQSQPPEGQGPARPISPLSPRPPSQPPAGLNPLRPPSVPPNRPMPTPSAPPPRQTSELTPRPPIQPAAQNPTPASSEPPTRPAPTPPKWLTTRSTQTQPPTPPQPPPVETRREPEAPKPTAGGDTDAMAWLESLAADQGDMFNLDLSSLMDAPTAEPETAPAPSLDPVAWLQNLSQAQGEVDDSTAVFARPEPKAETPAPVTATPPSPPQASAPPASDDVPTVENPFDAGVDPIAWLENLARRQGASAEELTTEVSMDIPVPENPVIDEPGYNPFSFDSPVERRPQRPEQTPFSLEDPESWLGTLADSEGFDEDTVGQAPSMPALAGDEDDVGAIERAISEGTVSPEQMQTYLEHQTDIYVEDLEAEGEPVDEDAPPVPAELPDWLLEQVGAPPVVTPPLEVPATPLSGSDDMPEWLREDIGAADVVDFENIFADDDDADEEAEETISAEPAFEGYNIQIDRSDPWVEAFEAEQEEGLPDITELPDWYVHNVNDPERIAAVEQMAGLAEAALPVETDLKAGEPVAVPSWAGQDGGSAEPEPEAASVSNMPDWLREVEASVDVESEEIPAWLMEDMNDAQTAEPVEAAPTPVVVETPPPMIISTPAPRPEPVATAPAQRPAASADLQTARTHADGGNLEASVASYEALIRGNQELDSVVEDLTRLVKVHRSNPAVHRVLGDGLMRQGKLQAALDIYREALNQL